MLRDVRRLGVAASRGVDSMCLLHVLQELAPSWNLCLTVLHLDHQLRGAESRGDADFVRDLAARLGLAFIGRSGAIRQTGNLEQNARKARLNFFSEVIRSG